MSAPRPGDADDRVDSGQRPDSDEEAAQRSDEAAAGGEARSGVADSEAGVQARANELARSLRRVGTVNLSLVLLVTVANWAGYPVWVRVSVPALAAVAGAVGLRLRRVLRSAAGRGRAALDRSARVSLAVLVLTQAPVMALAASGSFLRS